MKKQFNLLLILLTVLVVVCLPAIFIDYYQGANFNFRDSVYNWQQLIGSFLGAITPIGLFLATEKYQKKQKKKAHLLLLEKSLILAINNLSSIDKMLHTFHGNQLTRLKTRVAQESTSGDYSAGQAFLPFSATFSFAPEIMNETTDSSYLENLKLDVFATSQELPIILKDIDRQFDRTIVLNTQISMAKLNTSEKQNRIFLSNIAEFENLLDQQIFKNNIPIYLRKLASTLVAVQSMTTWGLQKWKETFPFQSPFTQEIAEKMDTYFESEVNKQIVVLQRDFKSKLYLVGEQSIFN